MKPEENRIILSALRREVQVTETSKKDYGITCDLINHFKGVVRTDVHRQKVEKAIKTAESVIGVVNSIFGRVSQPPPFKEYCWDVNFVRPSGPEIISKEFKKDTEKLFYDINKNLKKLGDRTKEIESLAVLVPFTFDEIQELMNNHKADITEAKEACKAAQKFGISLKEALGVFRISVHTELNLDNLRFV